MPMMRRRRPLLRAAAVGGGAYMAGKATANRRAEQEAYQADQDARISDLEAQQAQAQAPPPQVPQQSTGGQQPGGSSLLDQLNQLSAMRDSGALTDEEFAAAKAKLLALGRAAPPDHPRGVMIGRRGADMPDLAIFQGGTPGTAVGAAVPGTSARPLDRDRDRDSVHAARVLRRAAGEEVGPGG